MSDWRIAVAEGAETPEYLRFRTWRKRYRELLERLDAEDENLSCERVVQAVSDGGMALPAHTLVLAGFNEFAPRLALLLRALREQGMVVLQLRERRPAAADVERVLADEPDAEWRLAARWATDCMTRDPQGRYAIVSPRLQDDVVLARRVLHAELAAPEALGAVKAAAPLACNIAVGRPLRDWPVARSALAWLDVLGDYAHGVDCSPQQLGLALLAGHCAGAGAESPARAALDARWRRTRRLRLSAAQFGNELGQYAPLLAKAWSAALDAARACPAAAACEAWMRQFRQILRALGFPGDGALDSSAYQAMEALDAAFDRLAGLSAALGPQDFRSALRLLEQLLAETAFQPQRDPAARLDVLGLLEAEGGRWDGVWVLGLDDEVLPAAPRPNPLIPLASLRRAGAPRATPERELQWAAELYEDLLCSAPRVRISHAQRAGERELRPSPFIAELPARGLAVGPPESGPADMESLVDDRGPGLAAGDVTRGGSALLDTQSRNPLWAFVKYRLGAVQLDGYAELADLNARGNFLHRALEVAWGAMGSHAALCRLAGDGGLAALIEESVRQAADDCLPAYGPALRALEIERARKVLDDWLALERQRRPFRVLGREDEQHWSHEALDLSLRLDRVDELEDGSRMIIDYKSGAGRLDPKSSWTRGRPVDLQLPLYAAVVGEEGARVTALALVRLHARQVEAKGLSDGDVGLAGLSGLQDWPECAGLSWTDLLQRWRAAVEQLAGEYAAGIARNEFVRRDDMKYCDVLPFLRLEEEESGHAG
jgi:probable DNA repair protein